MKMAIPPAVASLVGGIAPVLSRVVSFRDPETDAGRAIREGLEAPAEAGRR